MIKKLFYSAIFLTLISASGFAQTYFLQNGAQPINMNDETNWNSASNGSGSAPGASAFTNSSNNWDMNGIDGYLSADLTFAGDLQNTGSLSTIDVQGSDLTLQGIVAANNLAIIDSFPLPSTSVVEYAAVTTAIKDIIPGTYTNLLISGNNIFGAPGNITVINDLSTSGTTSTALDMNDHDLIDGGSFAIGSLGSGVFTLSTQSTSSTPLPAHQTWPAGTQVRYNASSGLNQYIQSGSYDELYLASTGDKVISAGDTVHIVSLFFNNTNLVLEATNSGYGQLLSNVGMTSTGTITKQFYFDVSTPRYYHIGIPLNTGDLQDLNDGQTMNFANDNTGSVWAWDANTSEWIVPSATGNGATRGHAVFAGNSSGTDFITSTSKAVDVSASDLHHQNSPRILEYHDGIGSSATFEDAIIDGWNFIANPFLTNYDFEGHYLLGTTGTIGDYYYVFTGTNYVFYQKGGINNGGSTGSSSTFGANRYIAPGQGFWVRVSSDWDGTTTFQTADRKMNSTASLMQTTLPSDIIKLNVAEVGGSYSDQVIIRLDANATDNEDFSLDIPKKSNPGNVPNTFVQLGNGTWALCAANPSRKSFPLHFRDIDHGQQMEYSIWENTLTTYGRVFIEDKKNNTFTELTASNYTFTNDTAFGEDRFVIHFESGVGLPEGMIPEATAYDAFYSNETIQITFQEESFRPTTGSLYNLQGKLVSSFEINDANTTISIPNVSTGIYLLAIDGDTAGARKLYINK